MEAYPSDEGPVVDSPSAGTWKVRARRAEKKLEAMELVIVCCRDIIAMWPSVTFRTIGRVTAALETLGQAIKATE